MLNIEKYKEEIIKEFANVDHLEQCLVEVAFRHGGVKLTQDKKRVFIEEIIDWSLQEYKEPILTEEEKEYLNNVIKPFKGEVKYISKVVDDELEFTSSYNGEKDILRTESIKIALRRPDEQERWIELPDFSEHTMYKGMKRDEEYTLKELGL